MSDQTVVRLTCQHCQGTNVRALPHDMRTNDVCEHCGRIMTPIHMLLTCPSCGERHIDEGHFATKHHHTHACQECGMVWRPSIEFTVGVRFLPGYKNPSTESTR